jgi:gamma-glutamyltranspeptidase/glutathione hydrolase
MPFPRSFQCVGLALLIGLSACSSQTVRSPGDARSGAPGSGGPPAWQEPAPAFSAPPDPAPAPEAASGYEAKPVWTAEKFMISAANPLAAEAGYAMLRENGSALDAAIAAQLVLNLVEPQSSGIGGGAFLVHYDGRDVETYDGRDSAPAAADETLFRDASGRAMPFFDAVVGGRSVGVPGLLRMLEQAHREHGRLPWARLFEPAITLAERGFAVSPRLAALLAADRHLKNDPVARAYFHDAAGNPWPAGHLLRNPAFAATLRAIAAGGAEAFYRGPIAAAIVDKVRNHPGNPGLLALADLADYRVVKRQPVCFTYRVAILCGMGPPSSGALAVGQILGILEGRDLAALAPDAGEAGELRPEAVHLFAEAGRLAYADRDRYVGDPGFVRLPADGLASLLDPGYLARRGALIGERSMGRASAGAPAPLSALAWGSDAVSGQPATSHISVIDADGRALSMTTTIESAFGARQMVGGFLLNNQLTDFSFAALDADGPIANRVQGGKRPRSSMAPTLVFDKSSGELTMTLGSPGGAAIINYVAKTLVGVLDWRLSLQQAIDLPNIGSRNGPTELEQGRVSAQLVDALRGRGHEVSLKPETSGLQGITRTVTSTPAGRRTLLTGAADPRREGAARGE